MDSYQRCFDLLRKALKGYDCILEVCWYNNSCLKIVVSDSVLFFDSYKDAFYWIRGVYYGFHLSLISSLKIELEDET